LSLPAAPKRQIPVPWHGLSVVHAVIGRVPVHFRDKSQIKVGALNRNRLVETNMQGALWYHYGASPFTHKYAFNDCNCQSARFDVDDFGRAFFPDVGRFRVGVLDTNGNFLTDFGRYGNRDCGGPDSRIPEPEIAFAYPYTVAVSRTHVFVGDLLNSRIAKLRLAYTLEETADVK